MELDELRKKIEEEEENTKTNIEIFRDNLNKKEIEDFEENKDSHENNLLSELEQDLKVSAKGFGNKFIFKITKLLKKMGILSNFADYIYKQEEYINIIQSKIGWDKGDTEEYERKRMIIVVLLSILFTICILLIFLLFEQVFRSH